MGVSFVEAINLFINARSFVVSADPGSKTILGFIWDFPFRANRLRLVGCRQRSTLQSVVLDKNLEMSFEELLTRAYSW
jgi:hypothetical protein